MIDSSQSTSTRPYLLRALYEWCADNGLTPYVAAFVDETVKVPREHVKNNEIVLNISMDATSNLLIGNDVLQFKARFGGVAREIVVPIDHVIAIYARENGQGMAFPSPQPTLAKEDVKPQPAAPERRVTALHAVDTGSAPQVEGISPLLDISSPPAPTVGSKKVVKLGSATRVQSEPAIDPAPEPGGNTPRDGKVKPGSRPSLTRIK
jgi:stringent starvation protein B